MVVGMAGNAVNFHLIRSRLLCICSFWLLFMHVAVCVSESAEADRICFSRVSRLQRGFPGWEDLTLSVL